MCLAIPGRIASIAEEHGQRMAQVDFSGVTQPASLHMAPEAAIGDYVLVHVGFAISRIDAEEAARTWRTLQEMDLLAGELPTRLEGAQS
jgi:hydrogenase expression/formation protein HypC